MLNIHHENSHELQGSQIIRDYIFGGRGVVTLLSPTGVHHSYVFKKPRNEDQFPDDVYFVYALHNGDKLFYVGMIENYQFRLTRSSRFLNDTEIVKGARYIMRMAFTSNLHTSMKLYHEGICSVCGRPLTNPKSIEVGIGPRCRRRLDDR